MGSAYPFSDTARQLMAQRNMDYIDLATGCDRARSHTWWKNLLEWGPWKGPGSARVFPPDLEAIEGIARLFGTTEEQVRAMVAADWYGVYPDRKLSARALRLSPALDALTEEGAASVECFIQIARDAAEARAMRDAARGKV